ncbi:hypothetical protein [Streptomyces sp. NPDC048659]|uniref:hypothetical protein n=1 Tax=Streptomyces sp. NPDC048659 TaxID=3155489 RepID=UPI00342A6E62
MRLYVETCARTDPDTRDATRVPPFPAVAGTGVSAGERHRADGGRVPVPERP